MQLRLDQHTLIFIGVALLAGLAIARQDSADPIVIATVGSVLGLIGVGVGLLTIGRWPLLAVGLLLLISPTSAYIARTGIPFLPLSLPLPLGQILFAAVSLFYLVSFLLHKRRTIPTFKLFPFLVAWLLYLLATSLTALDVNTALKEWVKWLEIFLLIIITLDWYRQGQAKRDPQGMAPTLLVGLLLLPGLAQGLLGLAQFFANDGPPSFQILGRFYRAAGTFEQPNPFGGFLAWHTLLALGILLNFGYHQITTLFAQIRQGVSFHKAPTHPGGKSTVWEITIAQFRTVSSGRWIFLLYLVLAGGAAGGGLIASWSRGAWLGAASGLLFILLFLSKRWAVRLTILIGLTAAFVTTIQFSLLPAALEERISSISEFEGLSQLNETQTTDANFAVKERYAFWTAALGMARADLWNGIGLGNFDAAYPDHFVGRWENSLGHAHNIYLNLLAETGIWGLGIYVLFWGAVLFYNLSALGRLETSHPYRGLLLGLLGVWVALTVHHLVDNLYVNQAYFSLAGMLALQEIVTIENRTKFD